MEKYKTVLKKITPKFLRLTMKKAINILLYYKNYFAFKKINDRRLDISFRDRWPCVKDRVPSTSFDSHYLYHTAWAARILASTKSKEHIDIGSCLRFVSIVSAFVTFRFFDFRPPNLKLSNLQSEHADIISLPFNDNSVKSISCMHVIEHIGLGRYGDQLDPMGDIKGIKELKRVLAKSGQLLFVVPISGKPRIQFNAHRIYSYDMILEMFSDLKLIEFSLIPDNTDDVGIILNATKNQTNEQKYGCGCFHFIKE